MKEVKLSEVKMIDIKIDDVVYDLNRTNHNSEKMRCVMINSLSVGFEHLSGEKVYTLWEDGLIWFPKVMQSTFFKEQ